MAQNIYDDESFFAAYAELPRSKNGLDGAPEWPSLRSLLPAMAGCRVVDLGCGYGWFCRWAATEGAAQVLGIDLSERMLARAEAGTDDDRVTYERQNLDLLELPHGSFDLAFSSLTLHYLTDLGHVLTTIRRSLVSGGTFVLSQEHPIYTAPSAPAFAPRPGGGMTWPLDGYLREGPRVTDWLAPGVVKQHRTIGTLLGALVAAGFVLDALDEWRPSAEQLQAHPEWEPELDRPMFLLGRARAV